MLWWQRIPTWVGKEELDSATGQTGSTFTFSCSNEQQVGACGDPGNSQSEGRGAGPERRCGASGGSWACLGCPLIFHLPVLALFTRLRWAASRGVIGGVLSFSRWVALVV